MRLGDFEAVLFDIDGTLCAHHEALPGAVEVVRCVQAAGGRVAFVTNNSASTVASQVMRLSGLGIDATAEQVYTSGRAMADWIRSRWAGPRVCNFAGEALREELTDVASFVESANQACDVVAVGSHMRENDVSLDFDGALLALHHLRQGAELLIGSVDRVYMYDNAPEFGSGAWGALFAYAGDVSPQRVHYAGKPDPEFFLHLCERLDVSPHRCLLIGDNVESDVAGARSVGMTAALVLTGVSTPRDVAEGRVEPHAVFADLPALLQAMS